MVEVSSLYDLDIYTLAGQYVGRVSDVVLNIRYGTISRLQVKPIGPQEKRNAGFRDIFKPGFLVPEEENNVRSYPEGLLNIEFDRVTAIGDIMLINHQDLKRARTPVSGEEMAVRPRHDEHVEAPKEVLKPEQ